MGAVIGLTFLFGFGNVLALGLRLGVPAYVAPLVAPAVDLSVLGLLLGVRYLALNGAPREQIRPARRLLILASMMTLALNVAEPLLAGSYGKAAFDAVGPLLLIGWAEVGPGLLQAISSTGSAGTVPAAVEMPEGSPPRPSRIRPAGGQRSRGQRKERAQVDRDLLRRAQQEDARHREEQQRPISAETLRKRMGIGAQRSRMLVASLRSEGENAPRAGRPEGSFGEHLGDGQGTEAASNRVSAG